MNLFCLAMLSVSMLGGLWINLRMRSIDPTARFLGVIVGALPAAQPIGGLGTFAMLRAGAAYSVLRDRLGWM